MNAPQDRTHQTNALADGEVLLDEQGLFVVRHPKPERPGLGQLLAAHPHIALELSSTDR